MTDKQTDSGGEYAGALSQPRALRDILIVGCPIIVMAIIGNLVGASSLAGGAIVNLGYLAMIFVGARLLRAQGSSWREIGSGRPGNWLKTVLFGVAAFVGALILFIGAQSIAFGLLSAIGMIPPELDQSRFNPLDGNVPMFVLMLVLAWTTIAFGEEFFYRAFIITRLTDFTASGRSLSILIAGLIFGVVHFAEGPIGILANAAFGILFGWIFLKSSRNLWITIIAHGLMNTLRFLLLFAGAM